MIHTSTKYIVYTHGGTGVRHHHFGTQNNIIDQANGQASTGDTISALGFPTQIFNGNPVSFAFMSVHGAADGNHLYTSPGNQTVTVGSSDIEILVVYAPPGGFGGPNGGPGVWIDAFNVDTGAFSDSLDFVKILTPPTPPDTIDAAKTTYGNQEGVVSTLTAETVRANTIIDGNAPFLEWQRVVPDGLIQASTDIRLTPGETNELWFAFYQTTSTVPAFIGDLGDIIVAIGKGIFVWTGDDTCGNGGHWVPIHGPGPAPFKLKISEKVIAQLDANQREKLQVIMKEYPAAAQAAHAAMTNVTNMLKGAQQALGAKLGK